MTARTDLELFETRGKGILAHWRTAIFTGPSPFRQRPSGVAPDGENPHAHLMISERANDGIERSREQWFRRYNAKAPEKGGAKKSRTMMSREWVKDTREAWERAGNEALERAG